MIVVAIGMARIRRQIEALDQRPTTVVEAEELKPPAREDWRKQTL